MIALLALASAVATPVPTTEKDILVEAPRRTAFGRPVADGSLARMRGGLRLPNGLTVAVGIDIQTRVDGLLALRTIYASEGAQAGLRVYTGGSASVPSSTQTISTGEVRALPIVTFDRSPAGTTVVSTNSIGPTRINLVGNDADSWGMGSGQTEVKPTLNGPAVDTDAGRISLSGDANGTAVTLRDEGLEVRQLIGQATGVVIANSVNDRVIDTVSAIDVDVQGLMPETMAGIFAAQRAALDAVITRN